MTQLLSTIMVLLVIYSCEPYVAFTESQPVDKKVLSKFPSKIRGTYKDSSQVNTISVSKNHITKTSKWDFKINKNELDTNKARIQGQLILDLQTDRKIPFTLDNDSIQFSVIQLDTVFELSKINILKKYKGHYFLNREYGESNWKVEKLTINKGQLTISKISNQFDLDQLREITNTSIDTTYTFTPTKKDFKKFIKSGGFKNNIVYYKVK